MRRAALVPLGVVVLAATLASLGYADHAGAQPTALTGARPSTGPVSPHVAPVIEAPTFPLSIAVAVTDGKPARDDAWIAQQVDDANELYSRTHIRFRWTLRREISAAFASMHTRADRDSLAPLVEGNVIDVFVVAALEDVDEPGRYRKGVAWTSKPAGKRFLILSGAAPRTVLAHELGHFFGNGHSDVADNLMSYARTGAPVFLDDAQIARADAFADRFLATGRLYDVGPPRRWP
jgi:hypothetical protein